MKIKAKFDSYCKVCEQPTLTGTDVLWKKGYGVIHPSCKKEEKKEGTILNCGVKWCKQCIGLERYETFTPPVSRKFYKHKK